jgi:Short C-terminal domain
MLEMNPVDAMNLRRARAGLRLLLCCGVLLGGAHPAHAGLLDSIFGKGSTQAEAPKAQSSQRIWRLKEFTTIELVPIEAGAAPNRQPVQLQADVLRQQLMLVQKVDRSGRQPLFAPDELADLVEPLVQALGRAGPADDVLLLSTSRRDAGILFAPTAVTARLFVQDDGLQVILHDARFDFYDRYRGTNVAPRFAYGSRTSAGEATVQSAGASNRRADWLSIQLAMAAPVAPLVPVVAVAPAVQVAPPATVPAPPTGAPPPVRKALDATGADEVERRLETLKRLREKGLISEDEYQQKRKEILQLL